MVGILRRLDVCIVYSWFNLRSRIVFRLVIDLDYIEKYLDTYSLEEIFEYNELTEGEVLEYLVTQNFLRLPNPKPVDLDD